MNAILGVAGIILGAILTYYLDYRNTKKSNAYNSEREYIDKVCIAIIQYLENLGKKHNLEMEDIKDAVDYMEKTYSTYYMYIKDDDRKVLDRLVNSINRDFNTMIQNYATLIEHFKNKVSEYKRKNDKEKIDYKIVIKQIWYLTILYLFASGSSLSIIIGIFGIKVRRTRIELKNWRFDSIGKFTISFYDKFDPIAILIVGIFLFIVCIFLGLYLMCDDQEEKSNQN